MANGWRIGRFELLPATRQLLHDGTPVSLGARAFDLLVALAEAGEVVSTKDELMARAWPGVIVEENNLTVQVSAIRKLLGADAIATVAGRGYKLAFPVHPRGAPSREAGAQAAQKPSLAVLPFVNLSDAESELLCDGITEDVITELARFRSIMVVSRNTSFTYKGRVADARVAGRELGVKYVLEGSIRRSGKRLRLTARLVETATGTQIWSEHHDGQAEDVFEVQGRLTGAVAAAIAPQIELSERIEARARPRDLNTYQLAVRAWSTLRNPAEGNDRERRARATALASEVLAMDPVNVFAMRTMAWSAFTEHWLQPTEEHAAAAQEAVTLADRVIAVDNREYSAYHYRGLLHCVLGQADAGIADMRRALALNPNDATTMSYLGYFLSVWGHAAEGRRLAEAAVALSPEDPQRYLLLSQAAGCCYAEGDFAAAIAYATDAIVDAPWFAGPWMTLALACAGAGRMTQAREAVEKLREIAPEFLRPRLDGKWIWGSEAYRQAGIAHLRAAAGLET